MVSAAAEASSAAARKSDEQRRMDPKNFMIRWPVAKNLISKRNRKVSVFAARTYFSNVRMLAVLIATIGAFAQTQPGPATALYRQISNLGLDAKQVYNIRDGAIDREDVHISLDDGTI